MKSALSLRNSAPAPSPLEGSGAFRALQSETDLAGLARNEWWHWFSACAVTLLAAAALMLSFIPHLFRQHNHFYEIRADQAQWATAVLLVMFNSRWAYRQWSVRRQRKLLTNQLSPTSPGSSEISDPSGQDPVTGLYTRSSIEQQLGKEIGRARRENVALSLATIHIDEFAELSKQYGKSAVDNVLKEFARRMKKAIRGSDFAVRLSAGDFLLVLPECTLGEVKLILNRLGTIEITASGEKNPVAFSTGWVDYQPGESPSELLKRANHLLHLYENAGKDPLSTSLAS